MAQGCLLYMLFSCLHVPVHAYHEMVKRQPFLTSSGRAADGVPMPLGEDTEAELGKMVLRRRREAVREAWRRSASTDVASPSIDLFRAGNRPGLPTVNSVTADSALDDFTNEELVRRNNIFQGRL